MATLTNNVFDASAVCSILGLEMPEEVRHHGYAPHGAEEGEIVVYYGGWSHRDLCLCPAGKRFMEQSMLMDHLGATAKPGYYRLNLNIPGANLGPWKEQIRCLADTDESLSPAPILVLGTALLVLLMLSEGAFRMDPPWLNCTEKFGSWWRGYIRTAACIHGNGKLYLSFFSADKSSSDLVGIAGSQFLGE